jgi:hypothetical protein
LLPPATPARSIIVVDVHQPANRGGADRGGQNTSMLAEVARAEEVALAQFNRFVSNEVARGCLRPAARRNKRWARLTRRGLRRRHNRMASTWRAHKRKLSKLMNWVRAAPLSHWQAPGCRTPQAAHGLAALSLTRWRARARRQIQYRQRRTQAK